MDHFNGVVAFFVLEAGPTGYLKGGNSRG